MVSFLSAVVLQAGPGVSLRGAGGDDEPQRGDTRHPICVPIPTDGAGRAAERARHGEGQPSPAGAAAAEGRGGGGDGIFPTEVRLNL